MSALGEVADIQLVPVHSGRGRGLEAGGQQVQAVQYLDNKNNNNNNNKNINNNNNYLVRRGERGEPGEQLWEHLMIPTASHADGSQRRVSLPEAPETEGIDIKLFE